MIEQGDIVQITEETHHWFPALVIVSEPRGWGCIGYLISVTSNDAKVKNNPAYIRLDKSTYEKVGRAIIQVGDDD